MVCGGMADGHKFHAYLPEARRAAFCLHRCFRSISARWKIRLFHRIGAVVIMSDKDDVKDMTLNLMRFFEDESCGQCTPCRAEPRRRQC